MLLHLKSRGDARLVQMEIVSEENGNPAAMFQEFQLAAPLSDHGVATLDRNATFSANLSGVERLQA